MDSATISAKGTKRVLEKLESIINMKNLWRNGILSDNLRDEVGDCIDKIKAVSKKVDPTHMSIIINKHKYSKDDLK